MLPLVTVVIPNYNNARYLRSSINSVKSQTYKNIEILVIDDCSTDESLDVLKELSLCTPNLLFYSNDENRGVSYTRNRGIEMSKGEFITTLDPDDLYYENKIECEVKAMQLMQGKAIIFSGFNSVNDNLDNILFKTKLTKFTACNGSIFKKILYMSIPIPRDMLFTKQQFLSVNGFDENLNLYEDWDFKLKLAKKYKFYFSGSPGVKYRRHKSGLSSVDFEKHERVMKDIFLKHSDRLNDSYYFFTLLNFKGYISKLIKFILYIPIFHFIFQDNYSVGLKHE
ncbi:glycosyltransferase family 2 protein [Vibrio metschnikovii]|nr:glycosyltransferase family 2 protein [Vibrio metschnikovii]EKO3656578.1 glycosyltransferase family 2 protein [Vibrio metschnikovii]EKO3684279.1 glycosyltransferase family 2 protein [Vibrio metschnikovii]